MRNEGLCLRARASGIFSTQATTRSSDVMGWTITRMQEAMGSSAMTQIRSGWQSGIFDEILRAVFCRVSE
jgi:hypothetical protein